MSESLWSCVQFVKRRQTYRNTVSDSESHHRRLPEVQEAVNVVFVVHMKEDFGHLDTDLKTRMKTPTL